MSTWISAIARALEACPDVDVDEVPDLIRQRQKELEQEPKDTLSMYTHGMTLPTDKDYEV